MNLNKALHLKLVVEPARFVGEENITVTYEPSELNVADCITGVGGSSEDDITVIDRDCTKETLYSDLEEPLNATLIRYDPGVPATNVDEY